MAAKGVAIAAENMQAAESLIRDTDMAARNRAVRKEPDPGPGRNSDVGSGQPAGADGTATATDKIAGLTVPENLKRFLDVTSFRKIGGGRSRTPLSLLSWRNQMGIEIQGVPNPRISQEYPNKHPTFPKPRSKLGRAQPPEAVSRSRTSARAWISCGKPFGCSTGD